MFVRYGLPALAVLLLGFAVRHVSTSRQPELGASAQPIMPPSTSPFPAAIAAAGIVEAQSQNISIGTPVPGVVVEVMAAVGKEVAVNTPLFRLDDRLLRAELAVRHSALEAAKQELDRLDHQPRPEENLIKDAEVKEAQAAVDRDEFELNQIRGLHASDSATSDELARAQMSFRSSQARFERVAAQRDLLRAGTWEFDRAVAASAVERADAQVRQIETELEILVVRSPVEGTVLHVNVRPGEFTAAPSPQPLVVVGDIRRLHARVDIDEYDIPRFDAAAAGRAYVKGSCANPMELRFVRIEPYVIPKRALTGDPTERVDTRVIQVIYEIEIGGVQLYVGQQLDVFIQTSETPPDRVGRAAAAS